MKTILLLIGILVLALAGIQLYDHFVIVPVEASVQKSFTPVVEALDKHYESVGRYPDSLDALVPAYMKRLPVCPVVSSKILFSTKTVYGTGLNGKMFWLACDIGVLVYPQRAQYSSDIKYWARMD